MHLNQPVVGIAATPSGSGYWLVASDGGIFTFGDARFHGSTGAMHLNSPIVGMAATPNGRGYWLVAADGGIFTFGNAHFHGSAGGVPVGSPIVGMATTPSGHGYWLAAADGRVFTSATRARCTRCRAAEPDRRPAQRDRDRATGLWLVASDGAVYTTGTREVLRADATGSLVQAVGIARARRPRLLGRDRAVGPAAAAQLGHRPPHRLLEHPAAHLARRGERRRVAHVPRVGPPRPAVGRRAPRVLEGADVAVGRPDAAVDAALRGRRRAATRSTSTASRCAPTARRSKPTRSSARRCRTAACA